MDRKYGKLMLIVCMAFLLNSYSSLDVLLNAALKTSLDWASTAPACSLLACGCGNSRSTCNVRKEISLL